MENIFLSVLNMSLTASFIIAAIMLVRLLLKKAPKIISYALWAVAGFRLVFPFTLESMFSLLPFNPTPIPQNIVLQDIPRIDSGIIIIDNAVNAALPAATPAASVNPLQVWITVGSYIWFFIFVVMLVYSFISILLLKHQLRDAVCVEDNLYETGNLKTPFVIGLFKPKIYIPADLSDEERCCIIPHEKLHIRRGDHIIKMFAYLVLCLHWFNPMAWMAFLLMGADMEMSCDERVMRELGKDIKNNYSLSLVRVATGHKILNGSPLAFGEGGIKERVKNVLNYKKHSRIIVITAAALVAVLSVGFAVNRTHRDIFGITIPDVYVLSNDGASAAALKFSYTWNGGAVDTIAPWESSFKIENTIFAPDGEVLLQLSPDAIGSVSVELFLLDGTYVPYDGNGLAIRLPNDADEYICCFSVRYSQDNLHASYGVRVLKSNTENMLDDKTQNLPQIISIPVIREGIEELLNAALTVSELGYAIYLLEDFVLISTNEGDIIKPVESSPIMKIISMSVVITDGYPLPENEVKDGLYMNYHRIKAGNNIYDITISYPYEASEGGALLLKSMMDTITVVENSNENGFLYGTWVVKKFLGFTAITRDDVEWPDGERIIGKCVIIDNTLFSTMDFGMEYAKYAVEIQNPEYKNTYAEKGYDFAKYLSPTADKSILELNNEDIRLINTESADTKIAGPALYLINTDRLLISLNCDYFELEKVSSQIINNTVSDSN